MKPILRLGLSKTDYLSLGLISCLALIFRAAYLYDYMNVPIFPLMPYGDAYYYYLWAKDIASGEVFGSHVFMKWPLYAYLLGAFVKFFGDAVILAYLLQFFAGALLCSLVYLTARSLFDRGTAVISGLLCAWYGPFIFYEGLLMYVCLSLFLNSLLVFALIKVKDNPAPGTLFAAGSLLGVCIIAQPNVVLFGFMAVAWILLAGKAALLKAFGYLSCYLLGAGIVIGAAALANYHAEKDFVPIAASTGLNFYLGNNPKATGSLYCPEDITLNQEDMARDARIIAEQESGKRLKSSAVSAFWFNKAVSFIRQEPRQAAKLFFRKLRLVFGPHDVLFEREYSFIIRKARVLRLMLMDLRFIMPLALFGIIACLKRFKDAAMLYFIVIGLALNMVVFFVSAKLRIAAVPFLAIFAGYGLNGVFISLRQKGYKKFIYSGILLTGFFILSGLNYRSAAAFSDKEAVFNRRMMLAQEHEYNHNFSGAIAELDLALAENPGNRRAMFRLAVEYFYSGDLQSAEKMFKQVIEADPLSVDAYYNLGLIYNSQERFTEARESLAKAVYLDPGSAAAHFELGVAYKSTGDVERAAAHFKSALSKISRWRLGERKMIEKELERSSFK